MNDDRFAEIKVRYDGMSAESDSQWLIAEVESLRVRLQEPHRDIRSGMTQLQYGQWLMEQIVEHDDANGDIANHIGDELRDALRAACDEVRGLRVRLQQAEAERDALLYVPHKGPGVSPVVLYRTKEGHLVGQALEREEEAHIDTLTRALRAETRLQQAEAENVRLTKAAAEHAMNENYTAEGQAVLQRMATRLQAAEAATEAVAAIHRKSAFPASRGEHKGKHYCRACTSLGDEFAQYVDWPCATASALAAAAASGTATGATNRNLLRECELCDEPFDGEGICWRHPAGTATGSERSPC